MPLTEPVADNRLEFRTGGTSGLKVRKVGLGKKKEKILMYSMDPFYSFKQPVTRRKKKKKIEPLLRFFD